MPTWQAMEFLERVLVALAGQETTLVWDLHVIDSGSRDGTLECLERFRAGFPVPFSVESISPAAFDHGDTRNLLAARSRGELLVFLTQDAIPSSPRWLETLARNFDDPQVAAAYCRNIPRADCWPLTRVACQSDPGYAPERREVRLPPREVYAALDPYARRQLINFNDVASAVRREFWELHPFPRTMMGEDVLLGRAALEAGYTVVYDAESTVDHSHDYEAPKQRWRGEVDARFNAEWLDRICVAKAADMPVLTERLVASDLEALAALGHAREVVAGLEARARELRGAFVQGLYEGSQARRRYPSTKVLATPRLRVVFVVAGDASTLFGSPVASEAAHVRELGLALLGRGHQVTVLALEERHDPARSAAPRRSARAGLWVDEACWTEDAAGLAHLCGYLREQAPQVVHAFGRGATRFLAQATWARALPFVVTVRGDLALPARTQDRVALDELLDVAAAADACLVPSLAQRELLLEVDGGRRLEPRRVVPIIEGVEVPPSADDERAFPVAKTRAERVRIGVRDARSQELVLAALAGLATGKPRSSFAVRAHHGASVADGVAHVDVRLLEAVSALSPRDLAERFAELDLVVLLPESWSAVDRHAQLARVHGTPLIVHAGFGLEDCVRDGLDGFVVPRSDPEALAAALRRFVEEDALCRTLGSRSTELPSLEREVAELEFRYRGLAILERHRVLPAAVAFDVPGQRGAPSGATEPQGGGALLLRPGASVSFDLAGVPPGPLELELTQFDLGAEAGIALGGVVSLDGVELGVLEPSKVLAPPPPPPPPPPRSLRKRITRRLRALLTRRAPPVVVVAPPAPPVTEPKAPAAPLPDRELVSTFRTWLVARPGVVKLESRTFHSRLVRLRARSHTVRAARVAASAGVPEQLRIAESLRVVPGARVHDEALPTVAVIVPSFDGKELLAECLESLARAHYDPRRLRILVVDNGSSDKTAEYLRATHPDVQVLALDRNRGFAAACNLGARAAADARVLVFLNNDMRVAPEFLAELVAPLARAECAATVAKRLSWDGTKLDGAGVGSTFAGIAIQPGYGAPPGPEHEIPRRTLFPCGGAMAIDAAVFRGVGEFDEAFFAYYEDLDLGWRMWVMGHATHYVPTAIAYHHHSFTSKRFPQAMVRLVMIRNSLLACVKNYDDANLARILPVILALAARRAHLATGLDAGPIGPDSENVSVATAGRDARAMRIELATGLELARGGAGAAEQEPLAIRALGAADLVALDDLLGNWEHWMEMRRAVQARRARPDSAIFPMFLEPLACVEEDPAYRSLQRGLLALYRIPELFDVEPSA